MPGSRFLNVEPQAEHRRYKRKWTRESRLSESPVDARTRRGSRHILLPCCGQRRERCPCDWSSVEAAVCHKALAEFESSVKNGQLQRLADTEDCGPFLQFYGSGADSQHPMPLSALWGLAAMYRYFSLWPVWQALLDAQAVPAKARSSVKKPDFERIEAALERLLECGRPLHPKRDVIAWVCVFSGGCDKPGKPLCEPARANARASQVRDWQAPACGPDVQVSGWLAGYGGCPASAAARSSTAMLVDSYAGWKLGLSRGGTLAGPPALTASLRVCRARSMSCVSFCGCPRPTSLPPWWTPGQDGCRLSPAAWGGRTH